MSTKYESLQTQTFAGVLNWINMIKEQLLRDCSENITGGGGFCEGPRFCHLLEGGTQVWPIFWGDPDFTAVNR